MRPLLGIAIRASVMYVFALALTRLSGKRSLGKITPLDFIVVTIIGDLFDDVFWSEVPLAQGLTAFATVIVVHLLTSYATWRVPALERIICSMPTLVIQNGQWKVEGLRAERTPKTEVLEEMAREGEDNLEEIKAAYWEPSGQLSILKHEGAEPVEKGDLKVA